MTVARLRGRAGVQAEDLHQAAKMKWHACLASKPSPGCCVVLRSEDSLLLVTGQAGGCSQALGIWPVHSYHQRKLHHNGRNCRGYPVQGDSGELQTDLKPGSTRDIPQYFSNSHPLHTPRFTIYQFSSYNSLLSSSSAAQHSICYLRNIEHRKSNPFTEIPETENVRWFMDTRLSFISLSE